MTKRCRADVEAFGDAALVSALDKDIVSLQGFPGIPVLYRRKIT